MAPRVTAGLALAETVFDARDRLRRWADHAEHWASDSSLSPAARDWFTRLSDNMGKIAAELDAAATTTSAAE